MPHSPDTYFLLITHDPDPPTVDWSGDNYDEALDRYEEALNDPDNTNCVIILASRRISQMRLPD